mmetsp:Transcript_1335/g.3483  ORF Transcript_1335/g.3483 Transcript_1335/m.3483 type:complete len:121 (-) Transcript_1335:100-462(-)
MCSLHRYVCVEMCVWRCVRGPAPQTRNGMDVCVHGQKRERERYLAKERLHDGRRMQTASTRDPHTPPTHPTIRRDRQAGRQADRDRERERKAIQKRSVKIIHHSINPPTRTLSPQHSGKR